MKKRPAIWDFHPGMIVETQVRDSDDWVKMKLPDTYPLLMKAILDVESTEEGDVKYLVSKTIRIPLS